MTSWLVLRPLMMIAVLAFSWTCGSRLRLARSALALPCFGMIFPEGMVGKDVLSLSHRLFPSLRPRALEVVVLRWIRRRCGGISRELADSF